MEIIYLGHSSFKIAANSSPAGVKTKVSIITDPFDPAMVGLKFPPQEAQIVTVSHPHEDHNYIEKVSGTPKILTGPGEYEIKGVSVIGISSWHDKEQGAQRGKNTIYVFECEGLRIAHLGDLGHLPGEEIIDDIGEIDVLMIPVGGEYTIGPKEASEVVSKIEPYFVIPMHYKAPGISESAFGKLEPVESFLKESGLGVENLQKFSLKKEDIMEEQSTKVIVLSARN